LASVASALEVPDLSSYNWEQYKIEHNLQFNGVVEAGLKTTFEGNLKVIQEHNANDAKSFFMAPTKFTHLTNEEFRAMITGIKSAFFTGSSQKHQLQSGGVPDRVDWRETDGVVTDAKDQGGCGSCWAFSAVETLESHLSIATGTASPKLSPQQIVSCSPNPQHCGGTGGCDGSTQPLAFNYTATAGITTESNYPYQGSTGTCQQSKINPVAYNKGYAELTVNSYTELVDAVANKGPIAISIAAGGFAFQFYGGGVLKNCNDYVMDHAVQLVGYGTDSSNGDYWLVRTSWGSWGESGYVRVARYGEGNEPCGMDNSPQDGDACEGDTTPRKYCGECGVLSSSSYPTGMSTSGSVSV